MLFGMASAYRTTLTRSWILEPPTFTPQRLMHNSDTVNNSIQNQSLVKKIHSGNHEEDGTANSKENNSLNRIKNNVNWFVSNIKAPAFSLPDFRKVFPFDQKIKGSFKMFKKGSDKVESNTILKQQELKKKQMAMKIKQQEDQNVSAVKSDNFSSHIEDMNKSILSFYDTSAVQSKTRPLTLSDIEETSKVVVKSETKIDEASLWKMFESAFSRSGLSQIQQESKPVVRKDFVSKAWIDSRTRALVHNLKQASSVMSKLKRTEDLCNHLIEYPDSRTTAMKENCLPTLLRLYKTKDRALKAEVAQALSLVGYVHPPKGRGVRVLTVDGGGTRGLMAIHTLKKLQAACNTDITKLFDYVCGVSTGSLLAGMVFLCHIPLDEVEQRYIEFSNQMFTRNKLLGTGKLMWNHAFYDTEIWEKILKMNVNETAIMADFAKDATCPKYSAISCLMNVPKLKNFMFRTYNLPPGVFSQYPGNCKHKVWQAIRASSAAPGYYEEFTLGDYVHQDGGLLTNNPTAIAVHECKLLWPDESIQCVVSIGNGRFEPNLELSPLKSTLKEKVAKIIDSATDTEAIHAILQDLLPSSTYYRFNPYMSEDFTLDEIRPEKLRQMQLDTDMYLRKNDFKLNSCVKQLMLERQNHQKLIDWIKHKADSTTFAQAKIM